MSIDLGELPGAFMGFITLVIIAAVILLFCQGVGSWACSSKYNGSGMQTRYGLMEGCQVEVKPGQWIPEDRYRYLP